MYVPSCGYLRVRLTSYASCRIQTVAGTIEFRDPTLERSAGLTAADRKWMDDIVNDVNESWDDEDPKTSTLQ